MVPEDRQRQASAGTGLDPLLADTLFVLGYVLAYLGSMTLLRGLLLYINIGLAEQVPWPDLGRAFLVGLRFDLIIACILGLPLVLALLLPGGLGTRRLALWWVGVTGAITLFAGVAELEFYREFHTRLNSIAFHYMMEDSATVTSMIWNGFPVVRYLLLWLLLSGIYVVLLRRIDRLTPKRPLAAYRSAVRIPVFFIILLIRLAAVINICGGPLKIGESML